MDRVAGQVERRLGLHRQRRGRPPDRREVPERAFEAAPRPAMLLASIGVDAHRQLAGHDESAEIRRPPSPQQRAIRDVEVFGQRVVAPAAGIDDRLAPPDPGRAVEVEPVAAGGAGLLLDGEVAVDGECLEAGQQRIVAIDVTPPSLDEGEARVGGDDRDGRCQEVRRRDEVGVEDRDQRPARRRQALGEGARLEPGPPIASDVADVDAEALPVGDTAPRRARRSRRWNRRGPGSRACPAG